MAESLGSGDVPKVCRICLSKGSDIEFSSLATEPTREVFIRSTHLYVHENDGLPQRICRVCVQKCQNWLKFRIKAEENEALLRDLVQVGKSSIGPTFKEPDHEDDMVEDAPIEVYALEVKSQSSDLHEEIENEWEMILHDTTTPATTTTTSYPVDQHAPVVESAETMPTINRQGNDPVILCPVPNCVLEFVGFKNFEAHCLTHVQKKNIVCPICDLRYERAENFKNHMYIHANQKFGCPQCERLFTRPKTLSDHLREAHALFTRKEKEGEAAYNDPLEGFSKAPAAAQARKRSVTTGAAATKRGEKSQPPIRPIACPVCGTACLTHKAFEDHVITHTSRHSRTCPVCEKKFLRLENLKCHLYSHTDATFACDDCPRTFVNPKTLATHQRDVHQLLQSDKGNEEGTTVHTCSYCGKNFLVLMQLREHLKYHTADTRYPCTACSMQFRLKSSLNLHFSKMHKKAVSAAAAVICKVCGQEVMGRSELGSHMVTEHATIDFVCIDCGEVLESARGLQTHRVSEHTEDGLLGCHLCGRTFRTPKRLKAHMLIHADDGQSWCENCGLSFPSSLKLSEHQRKCHKDDVDNGGKESDEWDE